MKRRADSSDASSSTVIEGFADLERIGSGGFAVVYRARESAMSRDVAIKVINGGLTTEAERRAFERECRALGQLTSHPNIVTVYHAAFTTDMRPCIVMELYHGNFRERLERTGPLPLEELLSLGVRIAGALHTAHASGVLHRDLKPHNIFLSAYGEPALGDFGISTIDDERSHSGPTGLSVAYAAPEILEDGVASASSDVYALGATLYHLAAGTAPFASGDLRTTVRRILSDPPPPLGRADVPPGLDRVLRACMAKDPADRPQSALALAEMLREVQARAGLAPTPIPAPGAGAHPNAPVAVPSGSPGPSTIGPPPAASTATFAPPAVNPSPAVPADDAAGATIARRAPAEPPSPTDDRHRVSARRRWLAAGVGAVAVVGIVAGVALFGGDDAVAPSPSTVTTAPPPDTFFDALAVPVVNGVVAVGDGTFTVDIAPVADAVGYEVEPLGATTVDAVMVAAADLPAVIDGGGAQRLCVVVRALGQGGRVSRDSEPACSA